jgi:hypothetical protein
MQRHPPNANALQNLLLFALLDVSSSLNANMTPPPSGKSAVVERDQLLCLDYWVLIKIDGIESAEEELFLESLVQPMFI